MKQKNNHSPYEMMMEELFYSDIGNDILAQVMNPANWETVSGVPLRYRLIGLGFMKHQDLDELNESLMEQGCRPLYARNSFECTLIYAFSNKIAYAEWRKIFVACETVRNQYANAEKEKDAFFQKGKVTFGELESYVMNFSDVSRKGLETRSLTYALNEKIQTLNPDYNSFFQFYASVIDDFTDVHEKARYYFCKFFYYHLTEKIEYYISNVGNHVPTQDDLTGLLPIKAESALRRRAVKSTDIMGVLRNCALSPGALFEEFNYYFFGYVSTDWVELFLENVTDAAELLPEQIHKLADAIRNMPSKKNKKEMEKIEDIDIVRRRICELQQMEKPPNSRRGETAIRKYLRGDLDLDRTTLICFLLYFGTSVISRNDIKLSVGRLDEILDECGFSMLRHKNAFDEFVIKYMESDDPVEVLMLEMDKYISTEKNFYLYEVYSNSISNAKDIRQMMMKKLI